MGVGCGQGLLAAPRMFSTDRHKTARNPAHFAHKNTHSSLTPHTHPIPPHAIRAAVTQPLPCPHPTQQLNPPSPNPEQLLPLSADPSKAASCRAQGLQRSASRPSCCHISPSGSAALRRADHAPVIYRPCHAALSCAAQARTHPFWLGYPSWICPLIGRYAARAKARAGAHVPQRWSLWGAVSSAQQHKPAQHSSPQALLAVTRFDGGSRGASWQGSSSCSCRLVTRPGWCAPNPDASGDQGAWHCRWKPGAPPWPLSSWHTELALHQLAS